MVARDLISIKRPAGEYLVNVNENDEMTKYDATRKCASYGAVLASITEKSDYDAIQDVLLQDHEDGRRWKAYHVALDIAKDNSSRIFPNGVAYDYEKHGVFYRDNVESDEDLCHSAMLFAENRTETGLKLAFGCTLGAAKECTQTSFALNRRNRAVGRLKLLLKKEVLEMKKVCMGQRSACFA